MRKLRKKTKSKVVAVDACDIKVGDIARSKPEWREVQHVERISDNFVLIRFVGQMVKRYYYLADFERLEEDER